MPLYSSTFGKVVISEFEIHCLVLSLFTSLISPFGGFFASGLKRAMKIKDFSSLIPGHGGIIDRCDCQVIAVSLEGLTFRPLSPSCISGRLLEVGIAPLEVFSIT